MSLTRINALFQRLVAPTLHSDEGLARMLDDFVAFHRAFPDCTLFRDEDMVEARFDALAQSLALRAEAMKPVVSDGLRRVVRSRRAGNWRTWFCPEDVAHYRPLLAEDMSRYGYADEWALDPAPRIRPEQCSEYVLRLVRERRAGMAA